MTTHLFRSSWLVAFPLVFVAMTLEAGAEDYRLQVGDVVELTMLGTNGLTRRMTVDASGRVSVPIAGPFDAAGRSIDELRSDITESLAKKSLPAGQDSQGNETWTVIYPEAVLVEIAEFRPVYVTGAVLSPGEKSFRPGLTVRQAISLAGGFSLLPGSTVEPLNQVSAAESFDMYLKRILSTRARMLRLQAELRGAAAINFDELAVGPDKQDFVEQLKAIETDQFTERTGQIANEKQSIKKLLEQAEERMSLLAKKQKFLDEEMASYQSDLDRVQDLFDKGLIQATRLSEARRDVIFGSSRALETSDEVSRVAKELVTLDRSLAKLDEDHRIDVLAKLTEAEADLADAQSQAAIAGSKVTYLHSGAARGAQPAFTIFRSENGKDVRIGAAEDEVLRPGDVVEVSIPVKPVPAAQRVAG